MWVNFTNANLVNIQNGSTYFYFYKQNAGNTVIASNASLHMNSIFGAIVNGGTLSGSGTLNGSLTNIAGVVAPGTNGPLTISGTYVQNSGGTFAAIIGGHTAGTQYSQLADSGSGGTLAGGLVVNLANGFNPSPGDSFVLINSSYSSAGAFSNFSGLHLTNGLVLVPVYKIPNVTLMAANEPTIINLALHTNHMSFGYHSTTNFTNVVEYTTSINPPTWIPLVTNIGDGTVKVVTDPSAVSGSGRFYRVRFK